MFEFEIHSPEEEIILPFLKEKNLQLFIKREDLIHPFISGNKWRKLKYHLIKAKKNNKTHLITFGGAYSNHLLATACAAAKFGFKATAFVRGEEVKNDTLRFCKMYGMELIFTDRERYKDKPALFNALFLNDENAYFIDEGGAGKEAEIGCRAIVKELSQHYHHIFCAAGTGTTSAGILNAIAESKMETQFHMVPVLKNGSFLKNEIAPLLDFAIAYHIHEEYHFGGYAKTQPILINFIKEFAAKTGILTDPVYTSKTLFCIKDLVQKNYFKAGEKILMIHTGGVFGILGMMEKFD